MFVFLLGGVYFLFLLLLATLQIASHVHICPLEERTIDIAGAEVGALRDESAGLESQQLEQFLRGVQGAQLDRPVQLVEPDLHVANYIKIYLIKC